jgi:hypothetical protein
MTLASVSCALEGREDLYPRKKEPIRLLDLKKARIELISSFQPMSFSEDGPRAKVTSSA